ncbi:MAG: HIT domain-containing protein [Deltaproteobacteria bacterium]
MLHLDKDEALGQLELERERSAAFGGCVMCRLASPEHAHEWIAESVHGVVALDGYGATRGHLLVIARRHVECASDLDWPVFSDLQRLVWQASRALEAELEPARVYVASLGAIRPLPMSFPHHHTHVVPVYETDERARPANVFSWNSGVVRYDQAEADQLCARLRGALGRQTSDAGCDVTD